MARESETENALLRELCKLYGKLSRNFPLAPVADELKPRRLKGDGYAINYKNL